MFPFHGAHVAGRALREGGGDLGLRVSHLAPAFNLRLYGPIHLNS